jgi:hypothetical protein
VNTIIYCASWERGEVKFDEIMQRLQEGGVELDIKKNKRGSFAINRRNGNTWKVVYAFDGARANKWDYAIVDDEISLRTYQTIILPSCVHYELEPERRVSLF